MDDAFGVVAAIGEGTLIERLAEALVHVSEAVVDIGNKGTVTVTLGITKVKGAPAVVIVEQVKESPPVRPAQGAVFYAVDGQLSKRDPRQIDLPFKVVETSTGEMRMTAEEPQSVKEVGENG